MTTALLSSKEDTNETGPTKLVGLYAEMISSKQSHVAVIPDPSDKTE